MTLILDTLLMVLEVLDAISAERAAQAVTLAVTHIIPPLLDLTEHESASITSAIIAVLAKSWVVKNTIDNAIECAGNVDVIIVPALHDLRDNPLQDSTGDLTSRLIEYVGKMIFAEHAVGGIGVVVVGENSHLVLLAALDDLARAGVQLILNLRDDGHYVRRQQRENEEVDLVLELLNEFGQNWNLVDSRRDALHDVVVELDDRVDLLHDIVNLPCEGLRFLGTDVHVLHVRSVGVRLELVRFTSWVIASTAKDAWGNLLEDVLEQRSIRVLSMTDSAFKLLELRLCSLVAELAHHRVEEVDATESSSDNGEDGVTGTTNLHLSAAADMREDITLAHFDQSKLCVVAVRREIFQAVTSCTKQTQCLEEVFVILGVLVPSSQVDGFAKEIPDESRGGCDAEIFGSNVIFHAITFVNGELPPLVDRTAESPVVLPGIDVVGVVFGVVDVFFRAVTSKPLAGYLKLAGAYNVM